MLEPDNESLRILPKAAAATRIEPLIALGSTGRFVGKDWTVIGFQQRAITADGIDYPWQEYLLHHPSEGFRWLVEAEGHWNWVSPSPAAAVHHRRADGHLRREQDRRASAGSRRNPLCHRRIHLEGQRRRNLEIIDFIAPPKMLSRESSHNETTWSIGEYLPTEEVAAAFKLKTALPAAVGIGANQPNPRSESHRRVCRSFWKFLALAVVAQLLWFFILGGRTLLDQRLVFAANEEPIATQSFGSKQGPQRRAAQ